MKTFESARVQFTTIDPETEESYRITLSDLIENADSELIKGIGNALDEVIDGEMDQTRLTEIYDIV